jgi:hypothetical protein
LATIASKSGPMKTHAWLTMGVSAVASALIWASSPWLVGYSEPWDAGGQFYGLSLLIAGSVSGWLSPRPLWAHYFGAFVGQLGYEVIFLSVGPLFILGAIFLVGYSLIFLGAAAAAAYLRARVGANSAHA